MEVQHHSIQESNSYLMAATLFCFALVEAVSGSCLKSILPAGHIQVSIEPGNNLEINDLMIKARRWTFTVTDSCLKGFVPPPDAYLIILSDLSELNGHLERLSCNHQRWWPWVKTVVLLRNRHLGKYAGEQFARQTIKALWKKAVYSCTVLIEMDKKSYAADPFATGNRCGTEAVNVFLTNCTHFVQPYRNTFPGCEITVSARNTFPFSIKTKDGFEGCDVKLANTIASRSNLKINWLTRPSQQSSSNVKAYAYYGNLSRNEIDLAIGGSIISDKYFRNVTYVQSHAAQYIYFYVADGEQLRGWRRLVAMFSGSIWLYILLTVILSIVTLSMFGKKNISECIFIVLGILLEESVKIPQGRLRVLMICVVVPFYYLSLMYTSILHSYTMNPPSSYGISTLDELVDARLPVMVSDTNRLITDTINSKLARSLLRNTFKSPGIEKGAKLLNKYRSFTFVERELEMSVVTSKMGYTLHHVDYKIATIRNALVHPKGSKYEMRIHDLVTRSLEYGLWDKWKRDFVGDLSKKPAPLDRRPISWRDLDSAFTLFITGLILATVVLMIEIAVSGLVKQNDIQYNVGSLTI